jgi:hypothetical protein
MGNSHTCLYGNKNTVKGEEATHPRLTVRWNVRLLLLVLCYNAKEQCQGSLSSILATVAFMFTRHSGSGKAML